LNCTSARKRRANSICKQLGRRLNYKQASIGPVWVVVRTETDNKSFVISPFLPSLRRIHILKVNILAKISQNEYISM
jgi:hypothetical protein